MHFPPLQTGISCANLPVRAKGYLKTPSVQYFVLPKVAFTKDINILNMANVFFDIWFFAILKYVKTRKPVRNVPKNLNTTNKPKNPKAKSI